MRGKTARRSGVYVKVHEHSSTVLTKQLSSIVEFLKRFCYAAAFLTASTIL